jgi:O-antigen/teichoic acid export membrane protein
MEAPWSLCFQALAVLGLAKGGWILTHTLGYLKYKFKLNQLTYWWSIVYPLLIYGIIAILSGGLDPWLVGRYYVGDETQFAIYRYGARELPLIAALTVGLSQAVIPKIAADSGAGLAELKRETGRLAHLIYPVAIGLCATAEWWFTWVFTDAFAAAVPLFQLLLLTTVPRLFFNNTVLIARGEGRILTILVSCELLLNLVLSLLLLPHYGLWGLCLATVVALAAEKALGCWWLWHRHAIRPADYCPLPWWAGYSSLLVLIWLLTLL